MSRQSDGRCMYVYVVAHKNADGWAKPSKIGIARDPVRRLTELQAGNHKPLGIYATTVCPDRRTAREIEAFLHRYEGRNRLVGEWFNVEPEHAVQLVMLNVATAIVASGRDPDEAAETAQRFTKRMSLAKVAPDATPRWLEV